MLSVRRPWEAARCAGETARRLAAAGVGLVHVNSPVEATPYLLAARLLRRPSVVHVRLAYERRFLAAQGLALADEVIFNSRALRRELSWPRGAVIPNGVDLPPPPTPERRRTLRESLGAGDGTLLLGQVGHVTPLKGVDRGLEALARLAAAGRPVRLAVVGEDPDDGQVHRRRFEALARDLGVADRVLFTGYRRDAVALLGAVDVLLHPSRRESFGRVLIEAMAQEVPVVASRVGGIPEVVQDGREGYLVDPEDPGALAARVAELLDRPALRQALGRAGRRRAESSFSAEAHARAVAALYDRVAAPYLLAPEVPA
jgi:glycosyltransferase involved in cell wall biosynthesis